MAPTAINDCARRGELHAVARYFKAHADEINSQDDAGRTALHWAALGEVRVVDWLLRHGADGNVLCAHGRNAAHYAALGGKADIANR
ncbi:unnamed protein product [Pedinophyceae sp. YPF-701]|nr:unnamed protein product [Pedinophyceae sp. YPF-701]